MENPAQVVGIAGVVLGGAVNGVRTAAKRLDWEFPAWLDLVLGGFSLLLIAVGLLLLLRWFLAVFGIQLPENSPWPETLLYSVICAALIFTAGYLPARIEPRTSGYKTEWEPAIAESFFLHLEAFESGKQSTDKIKIVATEQGIRIARLIAQILKHYDWKVEVNTADGSHVFPASARFRGTRIRYRDSRRGESEAYTIFSIVSALAYTPDTEYFPEDDQYNFAQIEIGDVPEHYSGPPAYANDSFR